MLDTYVRTTKYNPFRGLLVRYKVMLLQDGTRITGTGEKVYEAPNGETLDGEIHYVGDQRIRVTFDGSIRKSYFTRSCAYLHMIHAGEKRVSSAFFVLRCSGWSRRLYLDGSFAMTASDASGTAHAVHLPLDQRVDEYHGVPIQWFSRLIEFITTRIYKREWQILQEKVASALLTSPRNTRTQNLHLPISALILAEDKRFYKHGGVDPIGIFRAIWQTVVFSRLQGGSTVEQQLVRVLLHDYRLSIYRKLKEIVLASRLHRVIDKDLIPVVYLTVAYYGWRMNGIHQAATHLGINLKAPTIKDAAMLVARIKVPEPHRPNSRLQERLQTRVDLILMLLRARPYLSF